MGRQAFNYYFDNKEELKYFIDAVNKYHQIYHSPFSKEEEEIGENFQYLFIGKLKRPYKRFEYNKNKKYFAGFGIGGGRGSCHEFFHKRGCFIEQFNEGIMRNTYKKSIYHVTPSIHTIFNKDKELVEIKESILNEILDKVVL